MIPPNDRAEPQTDEPHHHSRSTSVSTVGVVVAMAIEARRIYRQADEEVKFETARRPCRWRSLVVDPDAVSLDEHVEVRRVPMHPGARK